MSSGAAVDHPAGPTTGEIALAERNWRTAVHLAAVLTACGVTQVRLRDSGPQVVVTAVNDGPLPPAAVAVLTDRALAPAARQVYVEHSLLERIDAVATGAGLPTDALPPRPPAPISGARRVEIGLPVWLLGPDHLPVLAMRRGGHEPQAAQAWCACGWRTGPYDQYATATASPLSRARAEVLAHVRYDAERHLDHLVRLARDFADGRRDPRELAEELRRYEQLNDRAA